MTHQNHSPTHSRPTLALLVSCLVLSEVQAGCATQLPAVEPPPVAQPIHTMLPQPAQASSQDVNQLVAPIALYPDPLVAQVLAAATFPTEIVEADRWMQEHSTLKGDALAKAVDQQSWDSSVKALTQFPDVLVMMDKNLSWTSALGDAYGTNQATVMDAVQTMRRKAQQAGNLKSTPQEGVSTQDQTIAIEPADPEVVYVPEYDPWLVYGEPMAFYPDWVDVPGFFFDGPGIFFGVGIGIGVFGGFGWGWHHWGADWHHHFVNLNHHPFVSHSPTFGHFRPTRGPGAFGRPERSPGAIHSSAFSGFNHGGMTNAFSARGASSVGASRGRFASGDFHGGGFHGGGFHGGGHR